MSMMTPERSAVFCSAVQFGHCFNSLAVLFPIASTFQGTKHPQGIPNCSSDAPRCHYQPALFGYRPFESASKVESK